MKIFLDTADIERDPDRRPLGRPRRRHDEPDPVREDERLDLRGGPQGDLHDHERARSRPRSSPRTSRGCSREGRAFAKLAPNIVVKVPMSEEGLEAMSPLRRRGDQDELHPDLHRQPGPPRGEGRRVAAVAVRRPARRHQPGRDDRHPRARRHRDDPRARHRGPRGLDPEPAPHDPGRARRRPRRDAAVQGPPADGPPPAHDSGIVQFRADWEKARKALAARRPRVRRLPRCARPSSPRAHHPPDAQVVVELDEVGPLADGDPAAIA